MNELLLRRRAMAAAQSSGVTPVLPYDAEVEYLESSGTQYIDTGIKIYNTDDFEITARFKLLSNERAVICGDYFNQNYSAVSLELGGISSGKSRKLRAYKQAGSTTSFYIENTLTLNSFYEVKITYSSTNRKLTLTNITTGDSMNATGSTGSLTPYGNMLLFLDHRNNTSLLQNPLGIDWIKINLNGNLERDFVAVRVGTTGYMYDKVSGTLYGNNGTGNFILGNDVT